MKQDYLWDRTGPPDLEIQRLEETLAPLRYRIRPLEEAPPRSTPVWRVAAAAAVVMAVAGAVWRVGQPAPAVSTPWAVESVEGQARFGSQQAARRMAVPGGAAPAVERAVVVGPAQGPGLNAAGMMTGTPTNPGESITVFTGWPSTVARQFGCHVVLYRT